MRPHLDNSQVEVVKSVGETAAAAAGSGEKRERGGQK